jgi:hypothetical protein
VDYFTEDDKQQFKKEVTPVFGQDYFTDEQINSIIKQATPTKGVHYSDGDHGKDATIDQSMIDKAVEAALSKEKIDAAVAKMEIDISRIKGLDKFKRDIQEGGYKKSKTTDRYHGLWGGSSGGGGGGNGAFTFQTVTSNTALTSNDRVIFVDASSGPLTITLPDVASVGSGVIYYIKKIDTTANEVTVSAPTNTIDGISTKTLETPFQDLEIISSSPDNLWAIFH